MYEYNAPMSTNTEAINVNSDDPSYRQTVSIHMYNEISKANTIDDDHNETYQIELETTKIIDTYNENKVGANKIMSDNNMGKYKLMNINLGAENKKSMFNNNKLVGIDGELESQRKINTQLKLNELKKEFKTN